MSKDHLFTSETAREAAKKSAEVRRRKAAEQAPPPPPEDLEGCIAWTKWALAALADGRIDAATAHKITGLVGEMRRLIEKNELAGQLREAQAELKRLKAGRRA